MQGNETVGVVVIPFDPFFFRSRVFRTGHDQGEINDKTLIWAVVFIGLLMVFVVGLLLLVLLR